MLGGFGRRCNAPAFGRSIDLEEMMGLAKELKAPPCAAAPTDVSWVSLCQIESGLALERIMRVIVKAWYAVPWCTLARVA